MASLREAISELTEEVNSKAEETHALKEELKDLVQVPYILPLRTRG